MSGFNIFVRISPNQRQKVEGLLQTLQLSLELKQECKLLLLLRARTEHCIEGQEIKVWLLQNCAEQY